MVHHPDSGIPDGTLTMGICAGFPQHYTPTRNLSEEDDSIIYSEEHHCIVLTPDRWMCEDCGASFPRDPSMGDYPEEAIIEGGAACVAYVPEET